jgi:hypothetical protein
MFKLFIPVIFLVACSTSAQQQDSGSKNDKTEVSMKPESCDSLGFVNFRNSFIQAIEVHDDKYLSEHIQFPLKESNFRFISKHVSEPENLSKDDFFSELNSILPPWLLDKLKTSKFSMRDWVDYKVISYWEEQVDEYTLVTYNFIFDYHDGKFVLINFMVEISPA